MRRTPLTLLAVSLVACGGNGATGAPPSPVATGISISAPPGILFLGDSYTFSIVASSLNGVFAPTGGVWGSDAPTVATVDRSSGRVHVVGLGEATIFVDYQGQRTTHRIATTVRYDGQLNGYAEIGRCVGTGYWREDARCKQRGDTEPFWVTFTQNERAVTAVMALQWDGSDASDPVAAEIDGAGALRFRTSHRSFGGQLLATAEWTFRPSGTTQIAGTLVVRYRRADRPGYLEFTADVVPVGISRAPARSPRV